jgi:hypothetical protein
VLRCGVDVLLFILSRFKRLKRNMMNHMMFYTMHFHPSQLPPRPE